MSLAALALFWRFRSLRSRRGLTDDVDNAGKGKGKANVRNTRRGNTEPGRCEHVTPTATSARESAAPVVSLPSLKNITEDFVEFIIIRRGKG